ncbi:FBP domain-containing protein [Timonella sp. A28]|uniref:FBP domain-containing protein n=1 Tax=Timonella sp. A28 TaxID=3442640 RepID=UPI003EB8B911
MQARTLTELRAALENVDDKTRKTVRMPKTLPHIAWDELDYLGWRDPSAQQRGYIFIEHNKRLRGIMVTHAPAKTSVSRAVMCAFCRIPLRFEQVVLFTAAISSHSKELSTRGTYLCTDLDCNIRVNALQPATPLDPPAEELVAEKRRALATRTTAFIEAVMR